MPTSLNAHRAPYNNKPKYKNNIENISLLSLEYSTY